MNWRWLLFDFFDPAFGLSRPERKKIFASAMASKGTKTRVFLGSITGNFIVMLVCFLPLFAILFWMGPGAWGIWIPVLLIFFPITFYLVFLFCTYRAIAKPLRMAMHRHGYEYCHQCAQPLIGLGKDFELCPECGSSREPLTCQSCGYDLTGLDGDPPPCPECGDTQKKYRNPSRWWWLYFRQVDPLLLYFPDSVRRRIFYAAWDVSLGRFLMAMLLIIAMGTALALFFIPFYQEESALPWGLDMFLAIMSYPTLICLWCTVAASFHKTFGATYRREYRELGYDLCLKCGRMLHDLDEGSRTCPDCNATRLSGPQGEPRGDGLPTNDELKSIDDSHNAIIWVHASNRNRIAIVMALVLIMYFGGRVLVARYAHNAFGWTTYTFVSLSMMVGIIVNHRKTLRCLVRNDLHAKGHDLCPDCGFWFTQLGEALERCPECGEAIRKANPA